MDRRRSCNPRRGWRRTGEPSCNRHARRRRWASCRSHGYAQQQQQRGKVKITDVKCMIVRGTWDWNLIKIETDSGPVRDRRSVLGLGRQGPGPQQTAPDRRGRRSAQRGQAVHEDADGERRRGRDRRRHRDRGQRHRDRAVGSVRADSADARRAICWAAGSATASASTARCRPSSDAEDPQAWRAQVRGGARGEVRLDGVQVPGRRHSAEGRSRLQGAGPRPLHPRAHAQGSTAASCRAMEIVREDAGPGRRFRRRSATGGTTRGCDSAGEGDSSRSSRCGWKIRCRPATSKPWRGSRTRSTFRSAPARTCTPATASGSLIEMQALRHRPHRHSEIGRPAGVEADLTISRTSTTSGPRAHNPASPVGTIASCHAAASMRDFRIHELAQLRGLVAGPGDPRRAVFGERLLHDSGQARIRDRAESGCREGAPRARRDVVGLSPGQPMRRAG